MSRKRKPVSAWAVVAAYTNPPTILCGLVFTTRAEARAKLKDWTRLDSEMLGEPTGFPDRVVRLVEQLVVRKP